MAQVIWSPSAKHDLHAIYDLIAADSPKYAQAFVERLGERFARLAEHPMTGHVVREFSDRTLREITEGNYRIIHKVAKDHVQIVRIYHSRRMLKARDLP
ncbi:MAG: type II toxin-antitoxin system RelE/ParE family toxin [Flavobacteriales bacterium]|nr:MAG: type II toxin-antitoxin system RelE/ParE family toxin [Flavobacteriales bacterium]